jgi:hypothetical protein
MRHVQRDAKTLGNLPEDIEYFPRHVTRGYWINSEKIS